VIAGETFYLKARIKEDGHLHVTIYADPADGIVTANISSDLRLEQTCMLNSGDHPFISKPSLIAYEHTKYLNPEEVTALESFGIDRKLDPVPAAVLVRIQQGALNSNHTSPRIKALIRKALQPKTN